MKRTSKVSFLYDFDILTTYGNILTTYGNILTTYGISTYGILWTPGIKK